jgi:vacuolar-type H+-ATPase subunit F/Vma7
MGPVAILGEPALVRGWGLAGLLVADAEDPARARAAWSALPADTCLVILTTTAAAALRPELATTDRLVAVLP